MSWTYSGNPNASAIDQTHFLLGDVRPDNPLATDEECSFALTQHRGNTYLAAASLAETKAYELMARPVEVKRGDRTTKYVDPVQAFFALAQRLRQNASLATSTVYAGGLDVSEKEADRLDLSLVQPFARKHLHLPRTWRGPDYEAREP